MFGNSFLKRRYSLSELTETVFLLLSVPIVMFSARFSYFIFLVIPAMSLLFFDAICREQSPDEGLRVGPGKNSVKLNGNPYPPRWRQPTALIRHPTVLSQNPIAKDISNACPVPA